MASGIYGALSGAVSEGNRLEILSNNLANVNTPGFKQERYVFQSVLENAAQSDRAHGVNYLGIHGSETDFSQGQIQHTGRMLDLAIEGDGFFKVADADGFYYTRHGSFIRMPDGALVTRSGQQLVGDRGPVDLPDSEVRVNKQGQIMDANGQQLGQIDVYTVQNKQALQKQGNSLWSFDQAGLEEIVQDAGLRQGHIEASNVNPILISTKLIESNRYFQFSQRAIKAYDTLAEKTNSIGRIG